MKKGDKDLVWLQGAIKTPPFSKEARIEAGVFLRKLQQGGEAFAAALTPDTFDRTGLP